MYINVLAPTLKKRKREKKNRKTKKKEQEKDHVSCGDIVVWRRKKIK